MKRIVLIFGIISGVISSALMTLTVYLVTRGIVDFDNGEVVGYSGMVIAFVVVFFGIRAYREEAGGTVSFGRAFGVGLLIVLVASVLYVVTWEIVYYNFMPDFADRWAAHMIEKMRAEGASPDKIEATRQQMAKYKEYLANPLINAAFTFVEPLPVGIIAALISAAILRRKPEAGTPATAIA